MHGKQDETWPQIKGIISQNEFLVLVDLDNKQGRPGYYILSLQDWEKLLRIAEKDGELRRNKRGELVFYSGKWPGLALYPEQVSQHLEKWEKITKT